MSDDERLVVRLGRARAVHLGVLVAVAGLIGAVWPQDGHAAWELGLWVALAAGIAVILDRVMSSVRRRVLWARTALQVVAGVAAGAAAGFGGLLAPVGLLLASSAVRDGGRHAGLSIMLFLAVAPAVAHITTSAELAFAGPLTLLFATVSVLITPRLFDRDRQTAADLEEASSARIRLQQLLGASNDVILIVDDETVTWTSATIYDVLLDRGQDWVGTTFPDMVHEDDREEIRQALLAANDGSGRPTRAEVRVAVSDGSWLMMEIICRDHMAESSIGGIVLTCRDITERHRLLEQIRQRAFTDSLTGLATRAVLLDRIKSAVSRRNRSQGEVAVVLVDLDHFKEVNDTLGHQAGDAMLKHVATALTECVRDGDTAARLGGDEFALLLVDLAAPEDAVRVAQRVLARVEEPQDIMGTTAQVSASIGISLVEGETDATELLRNADLAMYSAKRSGKNTFEVFQPRMHAAVKERLDLETDVAAALRRGEVDIEYQPLVEFETGRVVGVEAFARWSHPTRGRVDPAQFVRSIESAGLGLKFADLMFRKALDDVGDAIAKHELSHGLSINLTTRQFRNVGTIAALREVLIETNTDPKLITLEIMSSAMLEMPEATLEGLAALRDLGVHLAIDNFGADPAALKDLSRVPADMIKIDRSVIDSFEKGTSSPDFTEAIIRVAAALGVTVLAAGVETEDTAKSIAAMGCHLGQGWFFGRPMSAGHLKTLLDGQANVAVG